MSKLLFAPKFNPLTQAVPLGRSPVWFVWMHLFLQDIRFKVHASCNSTIKLRNSFVLYTRFYFYKSIPLKLRCASDVQSIKRIFLSQLEKRLEMGCMLGSKPKHWNNWTQGSPEFSKVSCGASYYLFSINKDIWNNYQNIS